MRMMLKLTVPVEKGNQAFTDGSLGKNRWGSDEQAQARSCVFLPNEWEQNRDVFFDLAEPSQIIEVVEPLFMKLNAEVEITPVMSADDLRKGLAKASQTWSSTRLPSVKPRSPRPGLCSYNKL
jgi:hypothetical protein